MSRTDQTSHELEKPANAPARNSWTRTWRPPVWKWGMPSVVWGWGILAVLIICVAAFALLFGSDQSYTLRTTG
jgi:hypothetical protein